MELVCKGMFVCPKLDMREAQSGGVGKWDFLKFLLAFIFFYPPC